MGRARARPRRRRAVDGRSAPGVYGDTYGGYAEFVTIAVEPGPWSCGPTPIPDEVPLERAVFLEPLADCLHAVIDQAHGPRRASTSSSWRPARWGCRWSPSPLAPGARVTAVEPQAERRELAGGSAPRTRSTPTGGRSAFAPAPTGRRARSSSAPATRTWSRPRSRPAPKAGRVVLFAGFGDRPVVPVDVNALHYREIALVGSEWIGAPPNQRRERYGEAARDHRLGIDPARGPRLGAVLVRRSGGGLGRPLGVPRAEDGLRSVREEQA